MISGIVGAKVYMILLLAVFLTGLWTIFLRRVAAWGLVGQMLALKAVVAGAFLLAQQARPGRSDLVVLSLVALGMVPILTMVGVLVLHRCSRFSGTLDVDEEHSLRH